jgi:uncharacterized GH25 family protein
MMMRSLLWILLATKLMAQSPCALRGRVVDRSSGKPIEQAQVFVQTIRADATYRVMTNPEGLFCFRDLDSGSYKILVKRHGYMDVQAVDFGGEERATLVIEPRAHPLKLTISMSPSGVISGVVVLKSGDPLADAEVTLDNHFPPGGWATPDDPRRTTTGASGDFRFAGLEQGLYHLGVRGRKDMLWGDLVAGATGEQQIDTFYPASPSTDGAQAIEVAQGREVAGLVITMQTAPFRTIAGRVVAKDVPKYIMALDIQPSGASADYAIKVNPDGTFSKGGLPGVIYTVSIGPGFTQRVDLTRGDVTDLVIDLDKPRP